MKSNFAYDVSQCLQHAVERVKIANAAGDPILSAWLPGAEALLEQAPKAGPAGTRTVFCVTIEGESFGSVNWYHDAANRTEAYLGDDHVFFDLDVPEGATKEEIGALAELAAWETWYDVGRSDCRRVPPKFPDYPIEVRFLSIWEGGTSTSRAKLDLESGYVFAIEASDPCVRFKQLLAETIEVGSKAISVSKPDGVRYFVGPENLRELKEQQPLSYEPGVVVEVDFDGEVAVGAVKAMVSALNEVVVNVAGTDYGFHRLQIGRTMTSKLLAEKYPVKGSMPHHVTYLLYQLRETEVGRLSRSSEVAVADLQDLDRGARAAVASMLFGKCSNDARTFLLNDEHSHVRSCAVISQSELVLAN
ncbi:hypothetical protein BLA39750_01148 [Burkholderia lata]|uniref:Uncharacterized protein n=1 Tax=Burkholderia lata (strain ATCC 17760 / DSM 23089 / LMG 22485 / NCIMB 9086 / R18194 / 383) TaxID=482957 RepID=A0A6P2VCQ7_BURL3|nr:hypothetical protein [Burkholderia lata]VWC80321.1 hypothetical protein BLA39750_01148 [Burkholderia lata]